MRAPTRKPNAQFQRPTPNSKYNAQFIVAPDVIRGKAAFCLHPGAI
jgi:hypothetical protein